MSIFFYLSSMVMSLFVFIMNLVLMFSKEDSYVFRMFGDSEIAFCIFVALVLLVIGLIADYKERKEQFHR